MIDERQMEERHYSVYVHTSPSGKYYVGMTGRDVKLRWNRGTGYCGQRYFYHAIQKYSWENFEHEVIASHLTKEEANNFEKLLIRELKQNEPQYGYNITEGGDGTQGLYGEKNHMWGKHHTEETKRKISEANSGNVAWNRGKSRSESTKEKIRQAVKSKYHAYAQSRKVRCVETGEVFESAAEADRFYGFGKCIVSRAARLGWTTKNGYHWEYLTQGTPRRRPVKCIDTGEIFPSVVQAAEKYGGHCNSIRSALAKGKSKSLGHYWEYVEED